MLGGIARIVKTQEEALKCLASGLIANFPSHFGLFCGLCSAQARARWRPGHSSQDAVERHAAAERLYHTGWRFTTTALCPQCAKKNQTCEPHAAS